MYSKTLSRFLDYAKDGNTRKALTILSRLNRDDLAQAKELCTVPYCACPREFDHCDCDPETPAQYRTQLHAPKAGLTIRGEHFGRHKPIPDHLVTLATDAQRKSMVRGKEVLWRASCRCPIRFLPCKVHTVAIEVSAELEAAILCRIAPHVHNDLPPPPFNLEFEPAERDRIIGAMTCRLNCNERTGRPRGTMPRHPEDAWIDVNRVEKASEVFCEAFSRSA